MGKIRLFFLLAVFFCLAFVFKVSAQSNLAQDSQSWKCLRGDEKTFTFNGTNNATVTEDWYADGYQFDNDAYIVSCVGTDEGGICSTSNADYDELIFRNDNTKLFPYSVVVKDGAKHKIVLGKLRVTATVTTAGLTGGMAFYSVTLNDLQGALGTGVGQKLSTFPFGEDSFSKCVTITWTTLPTPTPVPVVNNGGGEEEECFGNGRNCMSREEFWAHERWDPFGIVFDSQSLEPMANIKVTIYDKNKVFYRLLGLTNPQTTRADGLFNFLVEPGTYYLTTSLPDGYSFTKNPNLHPNYIKIYHKEDGSNSIYSPDEPIVEEIDTPDEVRIGRPNIEHRDIPLDPGSGQPYTAEPSTVLYKTIKLDNKTTIDGRVSHPFTSVNFSQGGVDLAEIKSDRFGYYLVDIDNSKIKQNEDITITYKKADLTGADTFSLSIKKFISSLFSYVSSHIFSPVFAQTRIRIMPTSSSFTIPPILSYIEGFAYDKNGKVIPSARVLIKLSMNNAVFYETKANEKGFFQVPSKFIPIFPYYLQMVPKSGEAISYSTTAFVKQNEDYLEEAKINLIQPNFVVRAQNTQELEASKFDTSSDKTSAPSQKQSNSTTSKSSSFFIVVVVILFCLIGAIVLAYLIFKSRRSL
ncbi:hypothetical protein HZA76_04325 [Candidatus Roizmanbacteria bacterium]|nr:hypothetical protein [Candidatus Roizmanbacteria bacterium]